MPLDILPAPPAAPGGAASGASPPPATAAPSGTAGAGAALAVFGLLLAQIAPSAASAAPASPAPPGAAKSALLTDAAVTPAPTAGVKLPANPRADNDKAKVSGKDKPAIGDALWAPPVPIPPLPVVTLPDPAIADKTMPGKVMDTAPLAAGESLSQTQVPQAPAQTAQAPAQSQTGPVEMDVIVPAEADGPGTPVAAGPDATAAFTPLVPPVIAQASQAVVLPTPPVAAARPGRPAPAAVLETSPPAMPAAAAPGPAPQAGASLTAPTVAPQNSAGATPPPATVPQTSATAPPPAATMPQASAATMPAGATLATIGAITAPVSAITGLQNGGPPADNHTGHQAGKITGATIAAPQTLRKAAASGKASGAAADTAPKAAPAARAEQSAVPTLAAAKVAAGPAPGAAPMPGLDRARMVHQVADGVATLAAQMGGGGPRQVTVQLHPKDWGQVNVSVTLTAATGADGKVATQVVAHVVAENPAVKAALETHRADLRQALQDTGLHLTALTVTVQAPSAGSQAGPGGSDRQAGQSDTWAGAQTQADGTGAGGGTPFGGHGGRQAAFAEFAQGDSSGRRPPPTYAATPSRGGTELDTVAAAAQYRSGAGRVDIHA